jgi:drug/metabolite transporter (DMT)-like permease
LLSLVAVPVAAAAHWEVPRVAWTPALVGGVLGTSILATVGTYWAQIWAQKYAAASRVALLFTLEPVFAGLISYLFVGERLGRRSLAGAALILSGIAIAELSGGTGEAGTRDAP